MKKLNLVLITFTIFSCVSNKEVILHSFNDSEKIEFTSPNLFPEGIAYWESKNKIVLGSYGNGNIYAYDLKSNIFSKLIEDSLLIGPASIVIDNKTQTMYVANGDAGVSSRSSLNSTNRSASLLVYDLQTEQRIKYVDLKQIHKDSLCIANGLTLDNLGNIYISDSYRPVIYKIENTTFEPSVFVEDKRFSGSNFNLNGITYHPDGYLLALQMGTGELYKINIITKEIVTVQLQEKLIGADGITLINEDQILLTQAYELENKNYTTGALKLLYSSDNWQTALITDKKNTDCLNPTNSVKVDNYVYTINSSIGAYQFQGKDQDKYSFLKLKLTPYNKVYN